MKRALVLSGGGSRGAYQVGAYKALQEYGYTFDIIVGTSIGALNGALIAQNDTEFMYQLWDNMDITQVVNHLPDMDFSVDALMENKGKIASFFTNYVKDFGADTTPLQNLIRNKANAQKIKDNNITYGCVCTTYPSLTGIEITLDEMNDEFFPEYLLASSACFPAFPVQTIENADYIDGGYYDNTPIQFALRLKATEIIVIELRYPKVEHPEYEHQPNILTIRPTQDIGIMFNFQNEHLQRIRTLGYLDALRALHMRKGHHYTFKPNMNEYQLHTLTQQFIQTIQQADLLQHKKKVLSIKSKTPFTDALNDVIQYTNNEDYILKLAELCAKYLHLDTLQEYSFDDFINQLQEPYQTLETYNIKEFLPSLFAKLPNIKDELANIDSTFLLGILIRKITNQEQHDLLPLLPFVGEQIICAFFIYTLLTTKAA